MPVATSIVSKKESQKKISHFFYEVLIKVYSIFDVKGPPSLHRVLWFM